VTPKHAHEPCRRFLPHLRPCGPHPSGDTFYCACGCDGADTWCYQDEIDHLRRRVTELESLPKQ
jgi:hypothetical protein